MGKKILLAVLAVLCLCTGCEQAVIEDYATNKGYEQQIQPAEKQDEQEDRKSKIKVGVLHIGDPAVTSGYTYSHDLGIQGMQRNLGLTDDQIVRKNNINDRDKAATDQALQECVDAGCNIIFTTSFGYMDSTQEFAEKYPDIYFSHGTGFKSNGNNFNNYFGRIYQARYLSGIVAGLNTRTNKLGYVAAMDSTNSEVTGGIDAFAMGAYSVNPQAEVVVKVTNSWYDPEGEKAAAEILLNEGCDVITQHCDTSFPLEAAQQRGVYGIGYNTDMSKAAPDACLTSVVWNWSSYYTYAVQSVIDGTWNGKNYYGGMSENLLDLTPLAEFCAEGTKEKVEAAKKSIIDGSFGVFDGEIQTNTGEIVGEAGKTLDDATITGGINWYFKTVRVLN